MLWTTARYSRASCVARSVAGGSVIGSTPTQVAVPVPATPAPMRARCRPRTTTASWPLGSSPAFSILATGPTVAWGAGAVGRLSCFLNLGAVPARRVAAVDLGDQQQVPAGVAGGAGRRPRLGGLQGGGHDHPRQHDPAGQGEEGQGIGRELRHAFSRSMGCDALINAAPRPGIPGERKPLRCSGDGDGALHRRRVVLAVELVVAGRRGGEGDGGVLAGLHVLVDARPLEGEAVLGLVLVGHLDLVAGPGLEVQ